MLDADLAREFVRQKLRKALWDIAYHEGELEAAHKELRVVEDLLARAGMTFDRKGALARYEDDDDLPPATTAEQVAERFFGEAIHDVEWHENELKDAHENAAEVKALAAYCAFEFNHAELDREVRKRMAENRGLNDPRR